MGHNATYLNYSTISKRYELHSSFSSPHFTTPHPATLIILRFYPAHIASLFLKLGHDASVFPSLFPSSLRSKNKRPLKTSGWTFHTKFFHTISIT
ncbi:unknown protein [Desulfotalea psychrophila LSv54]|uniref:Uncharacterized protein n=1 Tax=Desulfotalea psychrophila (strain LSv54 / DSM 12343) TaxID=177439 RepID=Q6APE5_DESPS|nr:unknown protein [Desulfotalea psychrophila LSv54]